VGASRDRCLTGWLAAALASVLWLAFVQPAPASATTFAYTGGEQTYTVPADVNSIHVVAIGAGGGRGEDRADTGEVGGSGGFGDRLEAQLAVVPGQLLFIEVGGSGVDGDGALPNHGAGGFNGGGRSSKGISFIGSGGGGGGATDVRTCSRDAASCPEAVDTLHSRLLVAGGGGGGSGQGRGTQATGGGGGSAGVDGVAGQELGCAAATTPGLGGSAGTQALGGAGGAGGMTPNNRGGSTGRSGTFGLGGAAIPAGMIDNLTGGGGGGGYFGGGGGGGANGCKGGGGGGGSSFAAEAVAEVVSLAPDLSDAAQVVITVPGPGPGPGPGPAPKPSNAFSFGKLKLNKHRGTGTLVVSLPGPGTLTLAGGGLRENRRSIAAAGDLSLPIKAKGKSSRLLGRSGRVSLTARVTFSPTGGDPNAKLRIVRLIKTTR
jgi:Glycine rich protein